MTFLVLLNVLVYVSSYSLFRVSDILVRRTWVEFQYLDDGRTKEIYSSDIGMGSRYDAQLRAKVGWLGYCYYPLGVVELQLRGLYVYEEGFVPDYSMEGYH